MHITGVIDKITITLSDTFGEIDRWFDRPAPVRHHKPANGGWSIEQILEHIALTNHFLLILIEKGSKKAISQATPEAVAAALENYHFDSQQLEEIGRHGAFEWIRPEHMEPRREKSHEEVRAWLRAQLQQCLDTLVLLKNGEGVLSKTTMTVNQLGKIDVYQYIYFLAQHARRHIIQMEKIEREIS